MNLVETNAFLTWLSQHDGRIKVTDPSVTIWAESLDNATSTEVKQAVLDHYRMTEAVAPTPRGIRKACADIRARAVAKQSALTAGPVKHHPSAWRERNPELWDQLFEQGRREGNAVRARHTEARKES